MIPKCSLLKEMLFQREENMIQNAFLVNKPSADVSKERWRLHTPSKTKLNNSISILNLMLHF